MGHSRAYHIMGYGPIADGKRRVFCASSILEAHQERVRALREGVKVVEWTWQTHTGRKMLGLNVGEFYRKDEDMPYPKGLKQCPRCVGAGCQICRWAGVTTGRVLSGYKPWQLEKEDAK